MAAISGASKLVSPARWEMRKPEGVGMPKAVTWRSAACRGRMVAVRAEPEKISEMVAESVKEATEKCAEDPKSGECAAAWDEVEELSAAASHAKDRQKENSDPLETYCKDNPETDECRTYDN